MMSRQRFNIIHGAVCRCNLAVVRTRWHQPFIHIEALLKSDPAWAVLLTVLPAPP